MNCPTLLPSYRPLLVLAQTRALVAVTEFTFRIYLTYQHFLFSGGL